MPIGISNSGDSFPAGSVNLFADLPASTGSGKIYFVENPKTWAKNPRGFYEDSSTGWINTTIKVELAMDSGTVINWSSWLAYILVSNGISIGDTVIFNGIEYRNTTGIETTIDPLQDALNWDLVDSNIIRYYNDLGITINPFTVLHAKNTTLISGKYHLTPDIADASKWELTQGTLTVTLHTILAGNFGLTTKGSARITGGDTSFLPAPSQNWLSADGSGKLTNIKPQFPNYAISMGANLNAEPAPNGEMFVNQTTDIYDVFNDGWDGAVKETFDFKVTSDGATVIGTLSNQAFPLDNLTLFFSDGFYTLDTTTAPLTLALIPGTATNIQMNYIFIDQATKTLQTSAIGFPDTEHAKIARVGIFNASTTQTDGALINQNINDHIKKEDDNGHILHIAERLRANNAEWDSGTEATLLGTPVNLFVSITEGKVWQLHKQIVSAQDMATGGEAHVVNDPVTPYRKTTNLNDITTFSTGLTWNNSWSSIVVWGVANKSGEASHIMVNLPSNGYNSEDSAIQDRENYSDFTIPSEFKGVGFLIAKFTIRPSSGSFTYNPSTGYLDLRGSIPNNTVGGGAGSTGVFSAPQYTTTQRDTLTPENGWIIYNTTTNQFEFYENGAWVTK